MRLVLEVLATSALGFTQDFRATLRGRLPDPTGAPIVPQHNARFTQFRSSNIWLQSTFMIDTSLSKDTQITENVDFGSIEKAAMTSDSTRGEIHLVGTS